MNTPNFLKSFVAYAKRRPVDIIITNYEAVIVLDALQQCVDRADECKLNSISFPAYERITDRQRKLIHAIKCRMR